MAEGVFPLTYVGETAVSECSSQGNYVGTQKRTCMLGDIDGEWQKATGFCVSIPVLVVVLIIAIVVFLLMRTGKKAKAVGGTKGGKKSTASSSRKSVKTTASASNKSTKKTTVQLWY